MPRPYPATRSVVYHFPRPRLARIRCPYTSNWVGHSGPVGTQGECVGMNDDGRGMASPLHVLVSEIGEQSPFGFIETYLFSFRVVLDLVASQKADIKVARFWM